MRTMSPKLKITCPMTWILMRRMKRTMKRTMREMQRPGRTWEVGILAAPWVSKDRDVAGEEGDAEAEEVEEEEVDKPCKKKHTHTSVFLQTQFWSVPKPGWKRP